MFFLTKAQGDLEDKVVILLVQLSCWVTLTHEKVDPRP